jgi:hypothetical protein
MWPGGEVANAAVCKTAIHGCKSHLGLKFNIARVVELDIHEGLKILWEQSRASSSLAPGTILCFKKNAKI